MPFARPWQAKAIANTFLSPPESLTRPRKTFLTKLFARARELEVAESELHKTMPEHVKKIMVGKRVLLFEEVLKLCGVEDEGVAQGLRAGFQISGKIAKSGLFPERPVRDQPVEINKLIKSGRDRISEVMASTTSSGDVHLDAELLALTRVVVDKGWAS